MLSRCDCIAILHGPRVMMKKKSVERKWVVMAVAVYLVIMVDLVPSPTNASLLPAQHLPDAPAGFPRKALGGGVQTQGAISLDSYVDFGKNEKRKAVESRNLRASPIVSTA
ncbi:hypothetical protein NL676_028744 [Syzygium grande]|nr:hypothetical protein NL676_028744 [Syzygium grande]